MHKLIVLAATLALLSPVFAPALHAQTPQNPCSTTELGVYICPPSASSIRGGGVTAMNQPAPSSSAGGLTYIPYQRISADGDGNPCIETRYVPSGTSTPRPEQGLPDTEQTPGAVSSLYESAPPCPQTPRSGQGAAVQDPLTVALSHWSRIPLPRPQPRIAPGRAITGKPAYLETRGHNGHVYHSDTVFGPLEITATGSHYVEWGDGARDGPYSTAGGPWPDGQIVHEYLHVGSYDVVVTTQWTATWRLGDNRGILPRTQTTGRIDGFPVEQIQAVIG
jgi:hypothetical protein